MLYPLTKLKKKKKSNLNIVQHKNVCDPIYSKILNTCFSKKKKKNLDSLVGMKNY